MHRKWASSTSSMLISWTWRSLPLNICREILICLTRTAGSVSAASDSRATHTLSRSLNSPVRVWPFYCLIAVFLNHRIPLTVTFSHIIRGPESKSSIRWTCLPPTGRPDFGEWFTAAWRRAPVKCNANIIRRLHSFSFLFHLLRTSPPITWTLSQLMLYQKPSMNTKEVRFHNEHYIGFGNEIY